MALEQQWEDSAEILGGVGTEGDSMNDPVVLLPHIIEGETDIGGVYPGINPTALLPQLGEGRK